MAEESKARFRHEDVAAVPKGWRVRTVVHEGSGHRVRVAFPPGRRQKGSGRLISVLHPLSGANPCANPCTLKSANPQELLILGANPPRSRRRADKYRVRAVRRWHNPGETDLEKEFETEKEAKEFAKAVDLEIYFRAHVQKVRSNPQELLVMAAGNPGVGGASPAPTGANPPSGAAAAEIYERFTGRESQWVTVDQEPHMPKGDYAQLGKLLTLAVKPLAGGQVLAIEKFDGDPPLVVSDSSARQIYFFKGNQDISDSLERFGAVEVGNGLYELGEGREIHYQGRKEHVAHPEEDRWRHLFGEENGIRPRVLFDSRNKRLLLEGGDYRIEGAWIRN